jgi:hypothetical protein
MTDKATQEAIERFDANKPAKPDAALRLVEAWVDEVIIQDGKQ